MGNKYSNYKIFNFPEKIGSFVRKETTAPLYIRLKPVNYCNHDCFFCVYASSSRKPGNGEQTITHISSGMHEDIDLTDYIPDEKLLELSKEIGQIGVKALTYSGGGEPFLHRKIKESAQILLDHGVQISAITNGQMLGKDCAEPFLNASWIRVSVDYSTAAEMSASRNVPERYFEEVLRNIESFANRKSDATDLFVNYIVHRNNISDLGGITKRLKESGVENVRFSPMWVPDFNDYHNEIAEKVVSTIASLKSDLESSNFKISSTYDINMPEHALERSYCRCLVMETVPVIGADCAVYACHNKAFDKTGMIGSIKDCTFSDLWFSEGARAFFDNFNARQTCNHQCSNDSKNIILNEFLSASNDPFV